MADAGAVGNDIPGHSGECSMHNTNIYTDNELDKEGTYKKFLLVRQEGKSQVRRNNDYSIIRSVLYLERR